MPIIAQRSRIKIYLKEEEKFLFFRNIMAKQRHLSNAPITEAIIDFRVKIPSGFDTEKLLSVTDDLSTSYPKSEPRKIITGSFGIEKGKPFVQPPKDEGIQGYFFKSEDEKNIAQFRVDGFTFNRLQPYLNWETVLSEAKNLWKLYLSKAEPEVITRIAVRYINRLELRLPINDFSEYITAPPTVPDSLPQEVSQFLTKVVIHEGDITANIIQTLDKSPKPDHIRIILDIDVFIFNELGIRMEDIWTDFEKLHKMKNRIFFESITEKTARLYE